MSHNQADNEIEENCRFLISLIEKGKKKIEPRLIVILMNSNGEYLFKRGFDETE